jgi:adenine deaminase
MDVSPAADLAIENVTVIDPESRSVLPQRTIYITGGKIIAVLPAKQLAAFSAARVVKGTGKYVIPGLMDMHVHLFLPEPATPTLSLLLANGVTGVREMSSDCWALAGSKKGCIEDYRKLQARLRTGR